MDDKNELIVDDDIVGDDEPIDGSCDQRNSQKNHLYPGYNHYYGSLIKRHPGFLLSTPYIFYNINK